MAMTIGGKTPQSIEIDGKAVQSLAIGGEVVWSAAPQIPDYMRLKNISNESGIFKMVKTGSPTTPNLEYSLDGTTWTTYDFSTLPEVQVAAGETIYFRGTNANQQFNKDFTNYVKFSFDKSCEGHGNMCSLFNPDPAVFSTIASVGSQGLVNCFNGCTSLVTAPDLSNVTSVSYRGLVNCFNGCTSLVTAPDLSNVTSVGYQGLNNCFKGCTSLVTAPDLSNVTSVLTYGLSSCFDNCSKLGDVTAPNVQDLTANSILNNWLNGAGSQATGTKVVRVPTGATITTGSTSGIPSGWTRVDY